MKLAVIDRPIERIGTNAEHRFSIKATGKAFRVLVSGLYRDKILAIVREISCNAYDAHISAGRKRTPIYVHLPNHNEPWFAVRDNGPGLSAEDMVTIYTTFFESTKTDSNEMIGALGLGSKSPLAYVDSFTVTSWFDGIKRVYTVFFDEDDTPSITLMAEELSDEPTGLEVKIPAKVVNFAEFCSRAEQVYRYFDVPPTVEGNPNFKITKPEVFVAGPGYTLTGEQNHSKAIMGIVAYPITASSLGDLTDQQRLLLQTGVNVDFPIGSVEITAGREELGYDERTKTTIKNSLDKVITDLTRRVLGLIKKCPNEFEARKFYGKTFNRYAVLRSLFPEGAIPYRGKVISTSDFVVKLHDFKNTVIDKYTGDAGGERTSLKVKTYSGYNATITETVALTANDDLVLWEDDLFGKGLKARIRLYRRRNRSKNCYMLRCNDPQEYAALREFLDGVPITLTSTMEKPLPNPRAPRSMYRFNELAKKKDRYNRNSWGQTATPEDPGLYVNMHGGQVRSDLGDDISMVAFTKIYEGSKRLELYDRFKDGDVHGLPKSLAKDVLTEDGWCDYFTMIRERFITKMLAEDWSTKVVGARSLKDFGQTVISGEAGFFRSVVKHLPEDHDFRLFVNQWDACRDLNAYNDHIAIAEALKIEFEERPQIDLVASWKVFNTRYPMIKYMFKNYSYSRDTTAMHADVLHYIRAVDDAGRNCQSAAA